MSITCYISRSKNLAASQSSATVEETLKTALPLSLYRPIVLAPTAADANLVVSIDSIGTGSRFLRWFAGRIFSGPGAGTTLAVSCVYSPGEVKPKRLTYVEQNSGRFISFFGGSAATLLSASARKIANQIAFDTRY
jgi:hypothetical protein